jgi:hypothetical protein
MAVDNILVSMHGRAFGLSSSKGLLTWEEGSTGYLVGLMKTTAEAVANSTGLTFQPLKELSVIASVASSVGSTMNSYGTNLVSSGSATAVVLQIGRPTAGQKVEIVSRTSASELSFGGTSTLILFGAGTTAFLSAAGGVVGASIVLRGESTARYAVIAKSTDWVIT